MVATSGAGAAEAANAWPGGGGGARDIHPPAAGLVALTAAPGAEAPGTACLGGAQLPGVPLQGACELGAPGGYPYCAAPPAQGACDPEAPLADWYGCCSLPVALS